jgi:glycosyltransferase involved in cell wall biosynthesis
MPFISVVTPCYNEEDNVAEVYRQVKEVFADLPCCRYEHIFIDNASRDSTVAVLRTIAKDDPNVKVIVNSRNFGWIRSPVYGILQARGDAVINIVADLQDPPTLIKDFLAKWEEGYRVVVGVKERSDENRLVFRMRRLCYRVLGQLADIDLIEQFTGFGLYDQRVIEALRGFGDAYPYFRGMIAEVGFERAEIPYHQPTRRRGLSKGRPYALFDVAMLGMTSHTKVPLRLATILGLSCSAVSFLVALAYLVAKLLFWRTFSLGTAPLLVGVFFLASVQLFFLGLVGEYIGAIHTQVLRRPLVVEKERINFDEDQETPPEAGARDRAAS